MRTLGPNARVEAESTILAATQGSGLSLVSQSAGDEPEIALDSGPGRSNERFPITVAPARALDLPRLIGAPDTVPLWLPDTELMHVSTFRAGVESILPVTRRRRRVFVARAGDRVVGFVHFTPAAPDRRWQAIAIGASPGVYDPAPIWEELLRHATIAAGVRGVKRLYAKTPSGSDLVGAFRRVAFAPYATETVFVGYEPTALTGGVPMRRQQSTDTWAIHQLYSAASPKQVQYAEAFTSHRWDHDRGRPGGCLRRSWLLDDGHLVIAFARITSRRSDHVIEFMVHPEHGEVLPGVIDFVLHRLTGSGPKCRVFVAVRGYQVELATALAGRGFDPVLEQDLLVKYTTVPVRQPQLEATPIHAEMIERLPKRVPSFLHLPRHDESTP